nr:RNA-directed DNA polymerase, eukaryota, reverse transcriptase zinc-binding domain protein [Tanacetum cinerariifolium]
MDEIRMAVWSCGENKSPGPDGYSFEFFRKYWNIIDRSLWYRVIQAIHGPSIESHASQMSSNWCSILQELEVLKSKGFNFLSHCSKRIRDGSQTRFWQDRWLAGMVLRDSFPRIFALELYKDVSVASKMREDMVGSFRRNVRDRVERQQFSELLFMLESVSLSSAQDRWCCDLSGDTEFRVKDIRNQLLKNLFTIPCFNVPWPSPCSVKFVDGGICLDKICRQFQIGLPGSLLSVYLISLRRCWKVFSILRGGLFGCFVIVLSLMLRLQENRWSKGEQSTALATATDSTLQVTGPAMPTVELLVAAAKEVEVGNDDVPFIGPPPPVK